MHPVRGVSSSLAPIWHHLGSKMEQEAVPEAALTSLGSIFWRLGGGEKPIRSSYAAETVLFSQVWCSETRQNDFHGVLGAPQNGYIWYKPRLGTPKSEPHNEFRQGTEILMEI